MFFFSRLTIITGIFLVLSTTPIIAQQPDTAKQGMENSLITIENDGFVLTFKNAPQRVATLNQTPTEIMLALGLEDHMVGTAFMDDIILPEFALAYNKIPILAQKYPSKEILFSVNPDFVYGGFQSAFSERRGLPTRKELLEIGVQSYISPAVINHASKQISPWTIDILYSELQELGKIFRIEKRAKNLIKQLKKDILTVNSANTTSDKKLQILWLDNFGDTGPYVGGSTGAPNEIITLAGGENIFHDISKSWINVSKEQIINRHIDIIVLIETVGRGTVRNKIKALQEDPVFSQLEAVRKKKFVVIPFSASTGGIRTVSAIKKLAATIKKYQP